MLELKSYSLEWIISFFHSFNTFKSCEITEKVCFAQAAIAKDYKKVEKRISVDFFLLMLKHVFIKLLIILIMKRSMNVKSSIGNFFWLFDNLHLWIRIYRCVTLLFKLNQHHPLYKNSTLRHSFNWLVTIFTRE